MNAAQLKQYLFNNIWFGENGTPKRTRYELSGLPLIMPNTSRVWGIDISHWNLPPVDLVRMKDLYGLKFVIIKGCDGSIRSRYSAEHVATAKEASLPWGFYDWLYPGNRVSITAQVNAWVAQAIEFDPPMKIFIDAEWTTYGGQPANPSATDLRSAHDKVRIEYEPATTYTAKGYSDTYLQGFDWSLEDLWVANYGVLNPLLPSGANRWDLWQFTSTLDGHRLDPNGNAELDGNYWNGTQAEFEQRYSGATEPPPNGEPMTNGIAKEAGGRTSTIRSSPGVVSGNDTGRRVLPYATIEFVRIVVGTNSPNDRWFELPDNSGFVNYIYQGQTYYNIITQPTTPPVDPPANTLPTKWDVTQVAKDADGSVLATYTGTLTKQ